MGSKNRLKPTSAALVTLLLALTLVGWAAWELLLPHRFESAGPLTLAQAKSHSPISLPATATNIRIATYHHWIQTVEYVRFEAPVADCLAFAKSMFPDFSERSVDLTDAAASSAPFNPEGAFRDLSPFNLLGSKDGAQFGNPGPGQPCVWIDKDRGVFYYRKTD